MKRAHPSFLAELLGRAAGSGDFVVGFGSEEGLGEGVGLEGIVAAAVGGEVEVRDSVELAGELKGGGASSDLKSRRERTESRRAARF